MAYNLWQSLKYKSFCFMGQPWAISHSFDGKISFFSGMVAAMISICIFVSPNHNGKKTSIH
jgi:hypothetical protein